ERSMRPQGTRLRSHCALPQGQELLEHARVPEWRPHLSPSHAEREKQRSWLSVGICLRTFLAISVFLVDLYRPWFSCDSRMQSARRYFSGGASISALRREVHLRSSRCQ